MTVEDFLFRVETMRDASDYTEADVYKFFSKITRGRAQTFYWQFRNSNRTETWAVFIEYFKEQFKFRESDVEIDVKMCSRKQGYNESFNDFYSAIVAMNLSRTIPKSNIDLISLLRTNCRYDISSKMLTFKTESLSEMIQQCRNVEQFLTNYKNQKGVYNKPMAKKVNEIQKFQSSIEKEESENQEADLEEIICQNCDGRVVCCYKCHEPGVTYKNCWKCKENRLKAEMNRDLRPSE